MADVERRIATIGAPIPRVLRQWPVGAAAEALSHGVNRMAPGIRKQAAQPMRQPLLGAELKGVIRGQAIRYGPGHVGQRGTHAEERPAIVDGARARRSLIEIEV